MKHLVIVESPTKARTISKFLGSDYDIKFSMGHVMDLPKSKIAIDFDNNFAPMYEVIADKKKLIAELKSLAKNADNIILATDPDREGEAIAEHIRSVLIEDKKLKIAGQKFQRIAFHEITESAIKEALNNPREVDMNLVDAQTARRVLDRLVGYQLSPLLWKKVRRGLSAGRVQSVALRLIAEREREIERFAKSNYWTIHALLANKIGNAEFELFEINSEKIERKESFKLYDGDYSISKTIIDSEEKASEIVKELNSKEFKVSEIAEKQSKRNPAPPFTTSTLQQDASRRYGFSGKRTMSLAQKLYEEGFITYHRTDSVALSKQAIAMMRGFIEKEFGKKYLSDAPRVFSGKQKNAQEAHEGIRPTVAARQSTDVASAMGADYAKLYDLIWRRAIASQMAEAIVESTTVFAETNKNGNIYRLKAAGSVLVFDGFLKLNPQALKETQLPKFISGENLDLKNARSEPHETPAPPRYNEASIIQTLEEKGIGRPSTYAAIISTLVDRAYVERIERKFVPTPIGMSVNDFLVTNFGDIDDIPFTASMEESLDDIASGKKQWAAMMWDFYTPFEKDIKDAEGADRVAIATEATDEKCPECGKGNLVIRHGKFGKFFSCSTFPDCKFTKAFVEETNQICPKDSGKIIVRKTRKGRKFYGCANYPACDFAAWKLEDIKTSGSESKSSAKTKNTKSK
ncbi:MAG TPA: type I DNA topoisomerase [Candidatus Saccharimonadales bacterium]|nr:type I DNA topoisomerase [Candidatus Saccharimonadales bacterium]